MKLETATFAGGCFWCTEAIFKRLKGIEKVTPGYSGGNTKNPKYEQVLSGKTGHAETIQIEFNPDVISFEKLLEVFFKLHDPTTINRQGADNGTQYRSAVFYHNKTQKESAEKVKKDMQKYYRDKIVTEISPFAGFWEAENYYENYKSQPYCQVVIDPKIQKLYKLFPKETSEKFT